MALTTYKAYSIGTNVWAISEYWDGQNKTYHYAIFPAIVNGFYVTCSSKNINDIHYSYELLTPSRKMWGDDVSADDVNIDFNVLALKLKDIWEKHAEL